MRTTRTEHLRVTEGRNIRFGMDKETPVFDKAEAQNRNPVVQIGLDGNAGPSLPFRRSDADARPFKVVPFHEPDPDRIAKAEALRLRLAAQDEERMARGVSPDVVYATRERHKAASHRTKDTPVPRGPYVEPPAALVAIIARRDDQELKFANTRDAARCITGEAHNNGSNIRIALTQGKTAYGWTFRRVADPRAKG